MLCSIRHSSRWICCTVFRAFLSVSQRRLCKMGRLQMWYIFGKGSFHCALISVLARGVGHNLSFSLLYTSQIRRRIGCAIPYPSYGQNDLGDRPLFPLERLVVLLEAGYDAQVRLAVLQNVSTSILAVRYAEIQALTGQWYFVFRRKIRPFASVVFQQKLHPSAGPSLAFGQCPN